MVMKHVSLMIQMYNGDNSTCRQVMVSNGYLCMDKNELFYEKRFILLDVIRCNEIWLYTYEIGFYLS